MRRKKCHQQGLVLSKDNNNNGFPTWSISRSTRTRRSQYSGNFFPCQLPLTWPDRCASMHTQHKISGEKRCYKQDENSGDMPMRIPSVVDEKRFFQVFQGDRKTTLPMLRLENKRLCSFQTLFSMRIFSQRLSTNRANPASPPSTSRERASHVRRVLGVPRPLGSHRTHAPPAERSSYSVGAIGVSTTQTRGKHLILSQIDFKRSSGE